MVGPINASGVNAFAIGQNRPIDNGNAQDDGIIAKGIGVLKKIWLHVSGQAANVHSEQLSNLKAEVRTEMGEGGLQALSKALERHHWDGDGSTKLFSSYELRSLRSETAHIKDIRDRVEVRKKDLRTNIDAMMSKPKLREAVVDIMRRISSMENVLTLDAIEKYCTGDIQPTSQRDFQDLVDLCDTYFEPPKPVIPEDKEAVDLPTDDDEFGVIDPNTFAKANLSSDLTKKLDKKKKDLNDAIANGMHDKQTEAANELIKAFSEVKVELGSLTNMNVISEPAFIEAVKAQAQDEIKSEVLFEALKSAGLI